MMRRSVIGFSLALHLLLWPVTLLHAATDAGYGGLERTHSRDLPEWFKDSFLDLREDAAEAARSHKWLILFFHQDGCAACQRYYREVFADPKVARLTQSYFDVVPIDINGNREVVDFNGKVYYENRFTSHLQAGVTPTVIVFNNQGEMVYRLPGLVTRDRFLELIQTLGKEISARNKQR